VSHEGLSPETEELLRRAGLGDERMPVLHRRRLKGAVLARLAFASATVSAPTAWAALSLAAKAVVGVAGIAIVGTLGAGSYLALRPARHLAPHVVASPPRAAPVGPVVEAPPTVVEASVVEPPPVGKARARHVERHAALAHPSTLAAETALLRDADRALRAGDTATALARLDEDAARFPNGALAPERAGERLVVLCEVGAADARAVAQFLAARAGSPLAARVRRACAPKP
jgi:hypothetical protein